MLAEMQESSATWHAAPLPPSWSWPRAA